MLIVLTIYSTHLNPQSPDPPASKGALYQTISQLDADVFGAMNRCDMDKFASYWAEDIGFYQDKDGLSVGRKAMVDATKNNVCGKFLRELVPGTLEVHAIPGYGAIEIGVHRFLHPYAQEHGLVGEAKFMNVWRIKDGQMAGHTSLQLRSRPRKVTAGTTNSSCLWKKHFVFPWARYCRAISHVRLLITEVSRRFHNPI